MYGYTELVYWNLRENWNVRKKNSVLVSIFLPKIPDGLAWDRIWASTVTGSSSYIIINIYIMTDWNSFRRAAFDSMRKISSKKPQDQVHIDSNPLNYFHYCRNVILLDLIKKQLSFLNSFCFYIRSGFYWLEICTCYLDLLLIKKKESDGHIDYQFSDNQWIT